MARPRVQLRQYQPGDFCAFTPRADFAEEMASNAWDWSAGAPSPRVFTLLADGVVLGIGGFAPGKAVGDWCAFCFLAEIPRRYWPQLLWRAETALRRLEFLDGARRIFASARISNKAARPTLERLGFKDTGESFDAAIGEGVGYDLMVRRGAR